MLELKYGYVDVEGVEDNLICQFCCARQGVALKQFSHNRKVDYVK